VELPKPREEYVIPADPVGLRPPGEQPQGAVHLFVLALVSLYYHFAEFLRIALLGLVIALPLLLLFGCLLGGHVPKGGPNWQSYVWGLALVPVFAPFWAGLEYVVLLTVQRLFPKAREALRPFRSGAVYLNVLVAAGAADFGGSAFSALWNLAVFLIAGELPLSDPLADQALRQWPATLLSTLLFLPLVFAGLDVLASKASFRQAIARSIRFAFSQKRLVAGYAIIALTEATILLALGMRDSSAGAPQAGGETSWVGLAVFAGVFVLTLLVRIVAKALFYREFVWREREAAAPAATPREIA
jgi:hypothetical protein